MSKYKRILIRASLVTALILGLGLSMSGEMAEAPVSNNVTSDLVLPLQTSDYAQVTVKVMNSEKKGGGTGVILSKGKILTNKHICDVIQRGGIVIRGDAEEYEIESYKPYPKHDLCIITVNHDFGVSVKLGVSGIYEPAAISGHPNLFPLVVTRGHYSGWEVITLVVDIVPCDENTPEEHFLECFFVGGVLKTQPFIAQLVTSTIKPGSSGSPVFNFRGELTNLAFASASPHLDYAFVVPTVYLEEFITNEDKYTSFKPDPNAEPKNLFISKFMSVCQSGMYAIRACRTSGVFLPWFKK